MIVGEIHITFEEKQIVLPTQYRLSVMDEALISSLSNYHHAVKGSGEFDITSMTNFDRQYSNQAHLCEKIEGQIQ